GPAGDRKARHVELFCRQRTVHPPGRKEVVDMGFVEQMTTALTLTLNDACELQRTAGEYRRKKLTREQFIAAVEELANKIVQRAHGSLCVEQERTQRCEICDRTYPASEIIIRNGEQLCVWCHMDKYPLTEQDIPF